MDEGKGSTEQEGFQTNLLPVTYEEFKITKANLFDKSNILTNFLRPLLTKYAAEKSKYNIV